jgi:hypothetical protein
MVVMGRGREEMGLGMVELGRGTEEVGLAAGIGTEIALSSSSVGYVEARELERLLSSMEPS